MERLVRKNILGIKSYEPGKPIEEVQREFELEEVIKLASNENPLGPSPRAVAAIKKNLGKINRYPDSHSFYLRGKLAKRLGVEPSNLVMGNGSDEIIILAMRAFVNEGEEVLIADTTFLIYLIAAQAANARTTVVPMKNFKYDLKSMRDRITDSTKMIFIANPDNPTGTYVNKKEVASFMKDIPKNVIVFFDEAYYEFGKMRKDFPDTIEYLDSERIIIARTFSKAYGLSGLRVGYAVANPDIISYMNRVREPFNINLLAQVGALAALDDRAFLKKTLFNTKKEKEFLYKEFDKLGFKYVPSATNFILVDIKRDAKKVFHSMLSFGVIVRDMKAWGLDTYIRVTIGTKKENQKFIHALKQCLRDSKGYRW